MPCATNLWLQHAAASCVVALMHTLKHTPPLFCRFRFCGAVHKGLLYVIGGMAKFEPADATKHVVTNKVMRYTPSANKWEVLPGELVGWWVGGSVGHAWQGWLGTWQHHKLYMCGQGLFFCARVRHAQVPALTDPAPDSPAQRIACCVCMSLKLTTLAGRLNHPRADCCAANVGGKLYVAGGWTTDYADTLGSVEVSTSTATCTTGWLWHCEGQGSAQWTLD